MSARIWFEATTGGSARQRRERRADWEHASKAARLLAEVRAALVIAAAQGRGLRFGTATPWARDAMTGYRWRKLREARDLLYALRQGRAAGVLRRRVPS